MEGYASLDAAASDGDGAARLNTSTVKSVIEACVRIREPELLSTKLGQLKNLLAAATKGHAGGRVAGRRD